MDSQRINKSLNAVTAVIMAGSFLAALKCIIVGFQIDEEYAFTLSYRLIKGDRLLQEVWDPHQTSAFLLSVIEWIWIRITGSSDYIVIWSRVVTTILHFLVCFYLYKTFRLFIDRAEALLISLIIFNILPKNYIIPEFSLMMSWFLMLIMICLLRIEYFKRVEGASLRTVALPLLLGLFAVGLVLSYPSSVILIPFIIIYLIIKRKDHTKGTLLITLCTMAVCALAYMIYLLSYMSVAHMLDNAKEAIKACGSHGGGLTRHLKVLGKDALVFAIGGGGLAVASFIANGIAYLTGRIKDKKRGENNRDCKNNRLYSCIPFALRFTMTAAVIGLFVQVLLAAFPVIPMLYGYDNYHFFLIFLIPEVLYFIKYRPRKSGITFSLILNFLGYIAIMILTNMNSFRSARYLTSAVAVSLLLLVIFARDHLNKGMITYVKVFLTVIALGLTFYKGISYQGNSGDEWNITDARYVVNSGAAKSLITEYMTGYIFDKTYADWDRLIEDGDTVLVWDTSSASYFNKDVSVGSYTTISTPTYYVESVEKYWSNNPNKYPDVIAVRCWFGELKMHDEAFISWIETEYDADEVIDTDYYRYYIRRR